MSILHQPDPTPTTAASADLSVAAYQAFAQNHEPDVSAWTDADAEHFAAVSAQLRARVRQTGPQTWTIIDKATGEEHRFSTTVAAALWVENHLVTA